jgi:hypothetical protein
MDQRKQCTPERRKTNATKGKGSNTLGKKEDQRKERLDQRPTTRKAIGMWESGVHLRLGFFSM